MAIEIISGEEVYTKSNGHDRLKRWPGRNNANRLYPIAAPESNATFKIKPSEKIFCIGSCFAREISEALHRRDYQVLSIFRDLPKSPNRSKSDDSMFNKYNVASIYNELSWALDLSKPYSHEQFLIEHQGFFEDYQLAGNNYRDDFDHIKAFRESFNKAFAGIKEADVVVLTLGLSEVWFDKQTNVYLNAAPIKLISHYPGRFELHVFDYEETLSYLEGIYGLLKGALKSSFRLLVTVSPIPLLSTFRSQDVLVANGYSKAVLRAAVEAFVQDKPNVNYFPSYEAVTLSNPNVVWRENDFRHVHATFVDVLMGDVMVQFTNVPARVHNENQYLKARCLYYGNYLKEAKQLIKYLMALEEKPGKELTMLWAAIQLGLHGKSKSNMLNLLTYFQTYKQASVFQHIANLLKKLSVSYKMNFIGHIDAWDGRYLSGWACNSKNGTPIKVKILVDNKLLTTKVASNPRLDVAKVHGDKHLNSGFYVSLEEFNLQGKQLRVVFAETGVDLTNSPVMFK